MPGKFIKLRQLLFAALLFILLVLTGIFAVFRIPSGEAKLIQREISYQMIDIGQGDVLRSFTIESILNNRRIFLVPENDGPKWLYVSNSDFQKCWTEPPFKMKENGYTLRATFKVRPLLLTNGYSVATIEEIIKVKGVPKIHK